MRNVSILLMMLVLVQSTEAKDFGKLGNSFLLQEEGMIVMIKRKLKEVNIEEHQRKIQELAKKKVEKPSAVKGISRAKITRDFIYDPTYILREDIILPSGEVLHKAGTQVNPLDHMSLDNKMIFIDSRDEEQVKWFSNQQLEKADKLILVGGRPLDLEQELQREVYFDQFGELTTRFNIKHVPAIVAQEGRVLTIQEVNIDKR